MNLTFIWEALILLVISTLLLRIAGKKSISKMTGLELVIILAIGTTMGHAIKENRLWQVIVILTFFVFYLIVAQYLQMKFKNIQRCLTGYATVIIRNGKVVEHDLKKLRMTTEQLEMKLRQKGNSYISDVKTATIEPDGGLGYELMDHSQPITRNELIEVLNENHKGTSQYNPENKQGNLFNKVPHN